jgi:hypothetical protein
MGGHQCLRTSRIIKTYELGERQDHFKQLLSVSYGRGTKGRQLIITQNRYIRSVPAEAKPGDKLCVLFGCDVPVVLRKVQDEDETPVL